MKARSDLDRNWAMVADAIDEGPFLLGQYFSVVDISLLMIAQWHYDPELLFKRHPKLAALSDSVRSRPAIEEAWVINFGEP